MTGTRSVYCTPVVLSKISAVRGAKSEQKCYRAAGIKKRLATALLDVNS